MEHMQDLATQNPDKQKEMAKKLEEGKLSIRDWREQIQNVMNMSEIPFFRVLSPFLTWLRQGSYQQNSFYDSRSSTGNACRR
jgi:signal recognition particle subunit SRP54